MESELDLLLRTAINTLTKLEALLDLQLRPGSVQTPDGIAARLRRPSGEVTRALDELSEVGLLERFSLGTGRHVMYGSTEDPHVQALLDLLRDRYQRDPQFRSRVVRELLRTPEHEESQATPGPS